MTIQTVLLLSFARCCWIKRWKKTMYHCCFKKTDWFVYSNGSKKRVLTAAQAESRRQTSKRKRQEDIRKGVYKRKKFLDNQVRRNVKPPCSRETMIRLVSTQYWFWSVAYTWTIRIQTRHHIFASVRMFMGLSLISNQNQRQKRQWPSHCSHS